MSATTRNEKLIQALRRIETLEERCRVLTVQNAELTAERDAAQQRIAALEEALSVRVAIDDTNRTLAEDWKQMCRAARAAEKDGYYIEWLSEYGESFSLLQANIMDRLTRLPLPPAQREGEA